MEEANRATEYSSMSKHVISGRSLFNLIHRGEGLSSGISPVLNTMNSIMSSGIPSENDSKPFVASSGAGRVKSQAQTHCLQDSSLGPPVSTAVNDPPTSSRRTTEDLLANLLQRMEQLTHRLDALESKPSAVTDARPSSSRSDSPQNLSEQTANHSVTDVSKCGDRSQPLPDKVEVSAYQTPSLPTEIDLTHLTGRKVDQPTFVGSTPLGNAIQNNSAQPAGAIFASNVEQMIGINGGISYERSTLPNGYRSETPLSDQRQYRSAPTAPVHPSYPHFYSDSDYVGVHPSYAFSNVTIDHHYSDKKARPPVYDGDPTPEARLEFNRLYKDYAAYTARKNSTSRTKVRILKRVECLSEEVLERVVFFQLGNDAFSNGKLVKNWIQLVDDYIQLKGDYKIDDERT